MSGPSIKMTSVRERYERARTGGRVTKYVQEYMNRAWEQAAAAFAVETADAMGADTGMSIASLFPLGREVGVKSKVEAIMRSKQKSTQKPGIANAAQYGMPDNAIEFKTAAAGDALGEKAFRYVTGKRGLSRFAMIFGYDIRVLQWAFNEAQWAALDRGREAFERAYTEALRDFMPAQLLSDYINRGKLPARLSVNRAANTYTGEVEE